MPAQDWGLEYKKIQSAGYAPMPVYSYPFFHRNSDNIEKIFSQIPNSPFDIHKKQNETVSYKSGTLKKPGFYEAVSFFTCQKLKTGTNRSDLPSEIFTHICTQFPMFLMLPATESRDFRP